jgi:cell division protein FtsL
MYQNNTAYDFDLFAPKKTEVVEIPTNNRQRQKSYKQKTSSSAKTASVSAKTLVSVAAVVSVLLLVIAQLSCQLQNSEVVDKIHRTEQSIEVLQSENTRLQTELNGKISFTNMEEAARNMGMQKMTHSQTQYINLCNQDAVEMAEGNTGLLAAIGELF